MKRSPRDGYPYYCKICGLGYQEYMACEAPDCQLESDATAKARKKAGVAGLPVKPAIELVQGDSVCLWDDTYRTVKEVHPGYGHILKGAETQERCCTIFWQEGESTIVLRTQECILETKE